MSESPSFPTPALPRILEIALFLRIAAALAVEWYVRHGGSGRICIFPDAEYYWALARTIRQGTPYQVIEWGDIPHFALRTPGYPAFLAGCQMLLGVRPLGARLVQAGLGTLSVWLVYRLTRAVLGGGDDAEDNTWSVPLAAAALAAVHPYGVLMSGLILSEAVFVPVTLAALLGLAMLWNGAPARTARQSLLALAVGVASGLAILVRPSWALFVPILLAIYLFVQIRSYHRPVSPSVALAAAVVLGVVLVMAPWWVRNARVLGRFVPTAVWTGASLYDGLNPAATGASDMGFLARPEFWPLDELDQDQRLHQGALQFARENPGRVLWLALVKLGRFWSPWPNAEAIRSLPLALASTAVTLPLFALLALGLWSRRADARAWVLLAGPLLYFCALHLVFASSMRYRIPGEVPALGLAGLGMVWTARIAKDRVQAA